MRKISDYNDALGFLYSFIDYERRTGWKYTTTEFNLNRMNDFLGVLGNPHKHGWFVHVAGTNGKGSVCAMIATALNRAGYKTGLYTSPHLITFRERIRIDGSVISKDEVVTAVNRIHDATDQFKGLTFFEVWTGLAFLYFAESGVDVSVVEVGMGGRLDSTNVITPEVSVITSISVDHRGALGEKTEQIASEKAGIIKSGKPVVCAPQEPDVIKVIQKKADSVNAPLTLIGRDVDYTISDGRVSYNGIKWEIEPFYVPLNGVMQFENTAIALAALETIDRAGYPVAVKNAREGVENVIWPGRLQQIADHPTVIIDGACNPGAMKSVTEYITTRTDRENVVAVVAMCRDKDIKDVLDILGNVSSRFVLTQVKNPRAMNAHDLEKHTPGHVETYVRELPSAALEQAILLAGNDGLVLVTGSLYLVGDILRLYNIGEFD
ncbi:MAG: bifunctional folylpolyglutamate synthase/dihydrofolate synthase [Candidatus Latescibacteria bacterium]|nr:bifunctional folylpolyglutamate synthase/dihydrofolate synthase [Candidatus Latescibacterota bacterium]